VDPHLYDAAHRSYSQAIPEFFQQWCAANNVTEAEVAKSSQLAKQFVQDVMAQPKNTQLGAYLSSATFIGGKAIKAAVIVGGAFAAAGAVYGAYAGGNDLVKAADVYKQDVKKGADTPTLDLDAITAAVAVQTMTGDYFVTMYVLDKLLQ
jgi:hypothetical protein